MTTATDPAAIAELVHRIAASAKPFVDTGSFASEEDRRDLILSAEKLVVAAKGPGENIFSIATQVSMLTSLCGIVALTACYGVDFSECCSPMRHWPRCI